MSAYRQIIYVSSAAQAFDSGSLLRLLTASRRRNQAEEISGLLSYSENAFLQLFEGPEDRVARLLSRLRSDARHTEVTVLADRSMPLRYFPDWSMGFEHHGEIIPGPGLSSVLAQPRTVADWAKRPDDAVAFFEVCRPALPITR